MSLRGSLALLWVLALAGGAQAVEFDLNVKAPRASSRAELKSKMESVAAKVTGPSAMRPLDTVRNASYARERFDTRWMLGQMVDARAPLPEFEALGLKPQSDGSYLIDGGDHPGWHSMAAKLALLSDSSVVNGLEYMLSMRGFRPEDLAALRSYVDSHDLKKTRDEAQLTLLLSAGKQAKKLQKLKRLDDDFLASFLYQKQWQVEETERQWASGLLSALAPQAQRILESYFTETTSSSIVAPEDTAGAYQHERELLLRPDLERIAKTAFKEGKL